MSFYAVFDRIAPAQNKYMATLWNGAVGRKVVVNRVYRMNHQVAAVTGVLLEQELREITARTAGTNVAVSPEETTDPLTAGIACDTGSTVVTEGGRGLVRRFFATSEEYALTTASVISKDLALFHDAQIVYWRRPGSKGFVLPTGRGLTIKNLTNSTVGSVSYVIEFDDEAA